MIRTAISNGIIIMLRFMKIGEFIFKLPGMLIDVKFHIDVG
jgi:hypothetical protein